MLDWGKRNLFTDALQKGYDLVDNYKGVYNCHAKRTSFLSIIGHIHLNWQQQQATKLGKKQGIVRSLNGDLVSMENDNTIHR